MEQSIQNQDFLKRLPLSRIVACTASPVDKRWQTAGSGGGGRWLRQAGRRFESILVAKSWWIAQFARKRILLPRTTIVPRIVIHIAGDQLIGRSFELFRRGVFDCFAFVVATNLVPFFIVIRDDDGGQWLEHSSQILGMIEHFEFVHLLIILAVHHQNALETRFLLSSFLFSLCCIVLLGTNNVLIRIESCLFKRGRRGWC